MAEEDAMDDDGIDPKKTFYLAASIGTLDGNVDFCGEPIEAATHDLDEATRVCRELAQEHGTESYIYRCVPIRKISRGRVSVATLKPAKA